MKNITLLTLLLVLMNMTLFAYDYDNPDIEPPDPNEIESLMTPPDSLKIGVLSNSAYISINNSF